MPRSALAQARQSLAQARTSLAQARGALVQARIPVSVSLDGLISYWKLDEASSSRADSHGTNTLADNNTVTQAVGKLGNAALFTAANSESLSIADNASLSVGDIDFTVAAWVKLNTFTGLHGIITKHNGSSQEYRLYCNINGAGTYSFSAGGNDVDGPVPTTGVWHYVIAWHDSVADTVNIQVDNGAVFSQSTGGMFTTTSTAIFRIGAKSTTATDFFDGLIDSALFAKRIYSAAERTALYNSGAGLEYPFS